MGDSIDWDALLSEREALVEEILALPTPLAWERVRAAFAERREAHRPPIVYWMPHHSPLQSLAYDLRRPFVEKHGTAALDCLAAHATDPDPAVGAYSVLALWEAADARLPELIKSLSTRQEKVLIAIGSFFAPETLAEFAGKFLRVRKKEA